MRQNLSSMTIDNLVKVIEKQSEQISSLMSNIGKEDFTESLNQLAKKNQYLINFLYLVGTVIVAAAMWISLMNYKVNETVNRSIKNENGLYNHESRIQVLESKNLKK